MTRKMRYGVNKCKFNVMLASLIVLCFAGCRGNRDSSPAITDTTAPSVVSVTPANLAADVPINRKIVAAFSEAMDSLTLTAATFTVEQGTTPVAGTVACTGANATFTPAGDFAAGTSYTATITTGFRDLAGNALAGNYVWNFTTGTIADATMPAISYVSPADLASDVPINRTITATFSEAMDPLTVTAATFTVEQGTAPVAGAVACTGTTATFTPAGDFAAGTSYTATVATGAMDLAGNALAIDYVWSFTTGTVAISLNPVALGQASNFAVLAGYAVTTVPSSGLTGDVGLSPAAESFITGFSQTDWTGYATSLQVTGSIFAADMADPTPAMLTLAKGDLTIAYNDAAGRTPIPTGDFLNPGAGNLAGLNLVPGLYKFTGEAIATTDFTLTGGANDVWIFQIATTLVISNGVHTTLAGGARAGNIFWQVGTQATLGTTAVFHGTIIADASITMATGSTLYGRALAFSGTIAMDQCSIIVPAP